MSIVSEIIRLQTAKQEIRNALEKHGVVVDENSCLDTFAEAVENAPYAVTGTFTPEEDTQLFSVEGLPFEPETVYLSIEEDVIVSGIVLLMGKGKGNLGFASSYSVEGAQTSTKLSINSALVSFSKNGVSFNSALSSGRLSDGWFKAGYTYMYYIVGNYNSSALAGGNIE